jgi:creatinine amidohydrolase
MTIPNRRFDAMSAQEIANGDPGRWIAVLPLGATEQHGPHLPAETDAIIATGVADRLSRTLDSNIPATFLPTEPVGYSPEHLDYPTTRSLGYGEAIERWCGIGAMLAGHGIRKLLLLNAHGGNSPLLTIVATELRRRHTMLCVATSWTRHLRSGPVGDKERELGIHGGDIETSVMLTLRPDLVRMEKAANFASGQAQLIREFAHLRAYGPHAFGWTIQDLNPVGAVGNATAANPRKGEALLNMAVEGLARLVGEIADFDIARLDRADAAVHRKSS